MRVQIDRDITGFVPRGLPWAARDPVVNNVLITNADAARAGRWTFDDALWITVFDDGDEVVGAAMHTPPYHLFLCRMPVEAMPALADDLATKGTEPQGVPGVTGESATAAAFVGEWQRVTGATAQPTSGSRIYRLDEVVPPPPVAGRLRRATQADRGVLLDWTSAFLREAVPDRPSQDLDAALDRVIADGAYLWEVDATPVCYTAARPPAAGVARIGPVYTPPASRRRGFAAACVGEVSQRLLDSGATLCALYADLANPTSNGVYERLGYRPVADSQEYRFSYPAD